MLTTCGLLYMECCWFASNTVFRCTYRVLLCYLPLPVYVSVCLYPFSSTVLSLQCLDILYLSIIPASQASQSSCLSDLDLVFSKYIQPFASLFSSNMSTWSYPWWQYELIYKKFEPQSLPSHLLCCYSSTMYFSSSSESPSFIPNCAKLIQCICRFTISFCWYCVQYHCLSFLFCSQ